MRGPDLSSHIAPAHKAQQVGTSGRPAGGLGGLAPHIPIALPAGGRRPPLPLALMLRTTMHAVLAGDGGFRKRRTALEQVAAAGRARRSTLVLTPPRAALGAPQLLPLQLAPPLLLLLLLLLTGPFFWRERAAPAGRRGRRATQHGLDIGRRRRGEGVVSSTWAALDMLLLSTLSFCYLLSAHRPAAPPLDCSATNARLGPLNCTVDCCWGQLSGQLAEKAVTGLFSEKESALQ